MTPSREWLDAHLLELYELLRAQGDSNWSGGVANALAALRNDRLEDARSIYRGMMNGGRGFAEYYVEAPTAAERLEANRRVWQLRDMLWDAFDYDETSTPRVIGER